MKESKTNREYYKILNQINSVVSGNKPKLTQNYTKSKFKKKCHFVRACLLPHSFDLIVKQLCVSFVVYRGTTGRRTRRQFGPVGVLRGRLVAIDSMLSGVVQLIPRGLNPTTWADWLPRTTASAESSSSLSSSSWIVVIVIIVRSHRKSAPVVEQTTSQKKQHNVVSFSFFFFTLPSNRLSAISIRNALNRINVGSKKKKHLCRAAVKSRGSVGIYLKPRNLLLYIYII